MIRATGYIHKVETSGERTIFVLTVMLLAAMLALPMWGLFVLLLDFTIVFLPVRGLRAGLDCEAFRHRARHV